VRTGAAIFALTAGLAVIGLMVWTLVGMIRSASRRSRAAAGDEFRDAGREPGDGPSGES